ncbi:MAG: site-2 protease family protein [Bdellovibrionales bacterium]|nr:site-2 protease family protein [Bdellovibrionales bacterium]
MIKRVVGFVAITFLVIVSHELGHFAAARLTGTAVTRFSLGFGPVVVSRYVGPTEVALSLIPLGGYVELADRVSLQAMTAEDLQRLQREHPEAYEIIASPEGWISAKRPWVQFFVAIAGSLVNAIFTILLIPYLLRAGTAGTLRLSDFDVLEADRRRFIGPITMFRIAGDAGERGFPAMLMLTARFNIGVGLLQLLPLPILDGSHALWAALASIAIAAGYGVWLDVVLVGLLSFAVYAAYAKAMLRLGELRAYLQATSYNPLSHLQDFIGQLLRKRYEQRDSRSP